MRVWLRLLIIILIIFSVSAFVWFLLGSTAYFNEGWILQELFIFGEQVSLFYYWLRCLLYYSSKDGFRRVESTMLAFV